jgi:hypothetical protein
MTYKFMAFDRTFPNFFRTIYNLFVKFEELFVLFLGYKLSKIRVLLIYSGDQSGKEKHNL